MDYIVSAEDSPYYHWQLELLIESFKINNLQDNLLIVLAKFDGAKNPNFIKNLSKHTRILSVDNVGRTRGYPYLNKPYAVATAVNKGLIKQPFAVIDPDMILFTPLEVEQEPLAFQLKPFFNLEIIKENIPDIGKYVKDHWFPIGSIYNLNGAPNEIFTRIVSWAEMLAFNSYKLQSEVKQPIIYWRHLERVAWALGFLDYLGYLRYKGSYTYEVSLLDYATQYNFIHYTNGLPPVFSKHFFRFDGLTAALSPFEVMLEQAPTPAALYLNKVVRSYLELTE